MTNKEELKSLYEKALRLESSVVQETSNSLDHLSNLKPTDLVDEAFMLRKLQKLSKRLEQVCRRRGDIACKVLCLKVAQTIDEDGSIDRVRGDFCTASTDVKIQPLLPEKGSEEEKKLLEWLGLAEMREGIPVKLDFRSLGEYVTEAIRNGEKPPIDMTRTFYEYPVRFTDRL